ncbi:MAG: sigma-70 family RNA polymerase sigma factor [Dehalococcoidia bacterium]|nr:sigma-70 family RNA polymerase sigma factor [Dehalococcoidia bacterium]
MTAEATTGTLSDGVLADRARDGDRAAFATLYERHIDALSDFLARMLRDRAEAEDAAQDTLLKAMESIGTLEKGGSFKSWLFTIAYRGAISRLRAARHYAATAQDGESFDFTEIEDTSGSADPAAQAERLATADLIWEAASALDDREYAVLDLHLRQGLESPEIAVVLGVTRNHAAVLLSRVRQSLKQSTVALLLLRQGRNECAALDRELSFTSAASLSPEVRRIIGRHTRICAVCTSRGLRLGSIEAGFGGLAPVALGVAWKAGLLAKLGIAAGAATAGGAAAAGAGAAAGGAAAGGAAGGAGGSTGVLVGAGAAVAAVAVALAALFFFLTGDDPPPPAEALADTPTPTATATATATATRAPTQAPTATPTPSPAPSPTPRTVVLNSPAARVAIGELAVDAPVTVKGLLPDKTMASPDSITEVAWYNFTARPGSPGNAVFSGHVVGPNGEPGVFANLRLLEPGDTLDVELENGVIVRYRITSSAVYSLASIPMDDVLRLGALEEMATFITCDGAFIGGKYQSRLVVQGVRTLIIAP